MKKIYEFLVLIFVSFGGVGFLPKIPGTFGSVAALVILFLPSGLPLYYHAGMIVALFLLSLPAISYTEKIYGKDPNFIVVDEVIAMWLILLVPIIKNDPVYIVTSLVLFRVYDIWKPNLIKKVNEKDGAFYVIADDILAAGLTLITMYFIILLKEIFIITPAG